MASFEIKLNSLELNCSYIETEFSIMKLDLFALHLIVPEHSALCMVTHSVLTIQFHFSQFSFSLLRQTSVQCGR